MLGFTDGLTWVERNIFRTQGVCTTAVSPTICINLNVRTHDLLTERLTSKGEPVGNLCNNTDDSFDLKRTSCFKPKDILFRACSFSTYFMVLSIGRDLSICVGVGVMLAGFSIAPKTSNAGQCPSGPTVQFTANTAKSKYSLSVVFLSDSALMRSYMSLKGP